MIVTVWKGTYNRVKKLTQILVPPPLRGVDLLKETIYEAILRKPKGHDFVIERKENEKFVPRHMSVTGG